MGAAPLLRVRDLRAWFPVGGGLFGRARRWVRAVDGVSFDLRPGRTLGLVGESGCGKSTLVRTILRLLPATSGHVEFDGGDLLAARGAALRRLRRDIQIVFQDPVSSLNPRLRVETLVGEALRVHGLVSNRAEMRSRVGDLLSRVGLRADDMRRYPHEFSGGQRQRIGIARALALRPRLLILDEPVSALDVSIQSQILNLLLDLQSEFGLTYLFVAHNLGVVRHFCHDVAVMYLGKFVETAPTERLFADPRHPYTRALLAAAPRLQCGPAGLGGESGCPADGARSAARTVRGEPPSPIAPPPGCAFHPRCPIAEPRCRIEAPELTAFGGDQPPTHHAACFLADRADVSVTGSQNEAPREAP
ncbi:MAG: ABC transporter ATP-binding protein [Phycisphaerales bacterium]|nr:ABC transporter ATP-binding protein [Phycisphaerales bacterium]